MFYFFYCDYMIMDKCVRVYVVGYWFVCLDVVVNWEDGEKKMILEKWKNICVLILYKSEV